MTTNQKSVGLAAGLIVATLALIGFLTQANRPTVDHPADHQHAQQDQHPRGHGEHAVRAKLAAPKSRPVLPAAPQLEGARGNMSPGEARQRYAFTLSKRMSRRQKVKVTAEGAGNSTLKMTWPAEGTGAGHIATLKRAKPLFAELKGRGYTKLSCWIGKKEVWSKDL